MTEVPDDLLRRLAIEHVVVWLNTDTIDEETSVAYWRRKAHEHGGGLLECAKEAQQLRAEKEETMALLEELWEAASAVLADSGWENLKPLIKKVDKISFFFGSRTNPRVRRVWEKMKDDNNAR